MGRIVWFCFLPMIYAGAQAAVNDNGPSYEYYPVQQATGQSLSVALDRTSPIHVAGHVYYGYTRWHVDWKYNWWQEPDGRCRITSVGVNLSGVIQLPNLVRADAASYRRFIDFVSALKTHELGHYRNGQSAARMIDAAIRNLPQANSCPELGRKADAEGARIIEAFSQQDRTYDRQTEHGKLQGAWIRN